jgi:3-hydroxybutyryl-CoA dehydratase
MAHRNKARNFSEIGVGDKEEFEVIIDESMHTNFSKISGDYSPIHCDDGFSKKTKFGKKIGYAFLLTSFLSKMYGEYLPGGSSVCITQEANFMKPYYIGDKIKVIGEVVNKIESTNFVEIKTEMYRNDTECIFRGNGTVQILY